MAIEDDNPVQTQRAVATPWYQRHIALYVGIALLVVAILAVGELSGW